MAELALKVYWNGFFAHPEHILAFIARWRKQLSKHKLIRNDKLLRKKAVLEIVLAHYILTIKGLDGMYLEMLSVLDLSIPVHVANRILIKVIRAHLQCPLGPSVAEIEDVGDRK